MIYEDKNFDQFTIPLKSEIETILAFAHVSGKRHLKLNRSIERLYSLKIKYTGCTIDIQKHIELCISCNQSNRAEKKSKKYSKLLKTVLIIGIRQ